MVIYYVIGISLIIWWLFSGSVYKYDKNFTLRKWIRTGFGRKPVVALEIPKEMKLEVSAKRAAADLSLIVLVCALIFMVFQWWIQMTLSRVPEMVIARVELTAHNLRQTVNIFKINPWIDGILLYVLLSLPLILPIAKYLALSDKYSTFTKLIGKASQVLAVFTTFTFFGTLTHGRVQEQADNLELHSLQLIENNKLVHAKIYESIENDIADAFLELPEVQRALEKFEEPNNYINEAGFDSDVAEYASTTETDLATTLNGIFQNAMRAVDWPNALEAADLNAGKNYSHLHKFEKQSLTAIVQDLETSAFISDNQDWIRQNVSERSTKRLLSVLEAENLKQRAVYFEIYSPAVKKFFKAGYRKAIKDGFSQFFKAALESHPFLGSLVDIFVHDPLQEKIWEKAESYFKKGHINIQSVPKDAIENHAASYIQNLQKENLTYVEEFANYQSKVINARERANVSMREFVRGIKNQKKIVEDYARKVIEENSYLQMIKRHGLTEIDLPYNWRAEGSAMGYMWEDKKKQLALEGRGLPSPEEWKNTLWENRYSLYKNKALDVSSTFDQMVSTIYQDQLAKKWEQEFADQAARQAARRNGFWRVFRKVLTRGRG